MGRLMIPIMIPVIVFGAGKLYNRDIWIPPRELLGQIILKQLLPLAVGMRIARVAPKQSPRVQPVLNTVGNIVLTIVLMLGLLKLGPALKAITPALPVVALLLAFGCVSVVWLMALSDPIVKHTFAISNANRHVGLAVLLSGEYLHSTRSFVVIACTRWRILCSCSGLPSGTGSWHIPERRALPNAKSPVVQVETKTCRRLFKSSRLTRCLETTRARRGGGRCSFRRRPSVRCRP